MAEPRRLGGRFKLISLAGKGASGEVYRALDESTERIVAVKCLGGRLDDEHAEERFAREVRLLETISNPHVVGFVANGRGDDGRPFVAVEWLDGQDLSRRQKARPLDGQAVVEVITQVASGLDAIHALGFVHRDVKPSNIFVSDTSSTGSGTVRATVIDLGIAWSRAEPGLTRQGTMIGTPWYMSPEQILRNGPLSGASDLFSLGVLAFQLIAGVRPYRGDDALAIVAKIALTDPPRLRDVAPSTRADVEAVVARAMAKDPSERYASTSEFARALAATGPFETATVDKRSEAETQVVSTSGSVSASTMASGERRVVTAVFARFARADDASKARPVVERIAHQHGGVAHALLSLAHVVVFGSARSTGDEAHRAASVALAIAREIPETDVVVATGRTVGGVLGLPADAVDRGVRPRNVSPSNHRIQIDEPTARLLGDAFEIVGAPPELALVAERQRHERPRTFLGGPSTCFGREREIAQLEALYAEAVREPVARVAILVAPPGTGKSRVRQELLTRLLARDEVPTVLLGRGNAIAEGAPFGLLGSAIRLYADVRDGDTGDVQREKIARLLPEDRSDRVFDALLHIAAIGETGRKPGEDGVLATDRVRAAFDDWLADLAAKRPLVIVLEDVQWADSPSVSLIDSALRNLRDTPLFVLAIARPEIAQRFPKLFEAREPERLSLSKLTRKASASLVHHVVGDAIAPDVLESVLARADGNAFYLEELIRAVIAAREAGVEGPLVELPDTVLGTVQARLDALGAARKRIVKAVSIFGESATAAGVAAVLLEGDEALNIEGVLRGLAREEVFEERPLGRAKDESCYVFRHALLRDAAYELLLDDDRKVAHQRAGAWLVGRGEGDALMLARHFELGGQPDAAMPHYRRAAEQALYASDFLLAVTCAERALLAGATGEVAGELFLITAEAKRWSGDLQAALDAASRASTLLPLGSRIWFAAMRELIAAHGRLGNMAALEPLAARLSDTEPAADAVGAKIAGLVQACSHMLYDGNIETVAPIAAEVELLAEGATNLEPRAEARVHQLRATLAGLTDQPEEAIAEHMRALERFEVAGDQRSASLVRSNLAFALVQVGELERAETILRAALPTTMRLGLESVKALMLQNLGVALAWQGRIDEAFDVQTKAKAVFVANKDPRLEGSSRLHLAIIALHRGDLGGALEEVSVVLEQGVDALVVGAHAVTARVLLAQGASRDALERASLAAALLEKVSTMEEFEIYTRATLAEAFLANGDVEAATAVLSVARARVEARQKGIQDANVRKRLVERIPDHARVFQLSAHIASRLESAV